MSDPNVSGSLYARTVGRWIAKLSAQTGLPAAALVITVIAGAIVTLAGVGFTATLDAVMNGKGSAGGDRAIERFVVQQRTRTLTDTFRLITHLGGVGVVAPLGVAVVLLLAWRRHIVLALGVVVATGGVALITAVTKLLVARSRPPIRLQLVSAHGAAFPSGHSAESVVCYGVLAWIVLQLSPSRAVRVSACVAAVMIALAVGFSRLYLGVHWASDVVSGWFVGIAWLGVTIASCAIISGLMGRGLGRRDSSGQRWRKRSRAPRGMCHSVLAMGTFGPDPPADLWAHWGSACSAAPPLRRLTTRTRRGFR